MKLWLSLLVIGALIIVAVGRNRRQRRCGQRPAT